jgi:para-aminobenzoate synthetase
MFTKFSKGSMTGAPKLRSIHLLESLEEHPRGAYSGCLGYFSVTGASQFNVIIRSACFSPNGQVYLGAGGAIVSISDPVDEFDEMLLKSESVMGSLRDVYLV